MTEPGILFATAIAVAVQRALREVRMHHHGKRGSTSKSTGCAGFDSSRCGFFQAHEDTLQFIRGAPLHAQTNDACTGHKHPTVRPESCPHLARRHAAHPWTSFRVLETHVQKEELWHRQKSSNRMAVA